jgi:hypothetical protein
VGKSVFKKKNIDVIEELTLKNIVTQSKLFIWDN